MWRVVQGTATFLWGVFGVLAWLGSSILLLLGYLVRIGVAWVESHPDLTDAWCRLWTSDEGEAGVLHREDDEPAVIYANGTQMWYRDGKLHREDDSPAIIHADGTQMWYRNGELHREDDRPAVINAKGTWSWYRSGKRYRENGGPTVICGSGTWMWHLDGEVDVVVG